MLEGLARLRDIVIAIALAWIGISVQAQPDHKQDRRSERGAVSAQTVGGQAVNRPHDAAKAAIAERDCAASASAQGAKPVQCLDGEACPTN
jgi:hypothetical protein